MKTMHDRQVEVRDWTVRKGWRENPDVPTRTFGDDMALLHSEVSEALEAYRVNRLDAWVDAVIDGVDRLPVKNQEYNSRKPEGVGSEFADVLIRLLDNYAEWGLKVLDGEVDWVDAEKYASFGDAIDSLHNVISACSNAHSAYKEMSKDFLKEVVSDNFQNILIELQVVCFFYQIDLLAEYEAKMEYNETRSHRHGGKNL